MTLQMASAEVETPAERSELPPTSLVICSRNRPRLLMDTIESILKGAELPAELVIIDQSDRPDPAITGMQVKDGCQVNYVWTQTRGLCRARNMGIRAARHEILAFTDDDMWAAPDWYGALVRALVVAGHDTVVTGRVLPGEAETPGSFTPVWMDGDVLQRYQGRLARDVLAAGHMAMFRSVILAVGEFDERLGAGARFPAADDNDFGFRVLEAGYTILFAPQAVLYHRAWREQSDFNRMRWNYGRGKGGFFAKHLSGFMLRRVVTDTGLKLLRFPWRFIHRPPLAIGDLIYSLGVFSGMLEWLLTQTRARRVAGERSRVVEER